MGDSRGLRGPRSQATARRVLDVGAPEGHPQLVEDPARRRRVFGRRCDPREHAMAMSSRKVLEDAVRLLDARGVPHSEVRDLGEAFGIVILIFRDPDNIQLELSAARWEARGEPSRPLRLVNAGRRAARA